MAEDNRIVLTFGGGINARRRAADIDVNECVRGQNFDLDPQFFAFQRRKPFDLVGTATNGEEIRGFAQLIRRDGTVSTLVQSGTTVYEWDGASSFTQRGTVSASARLRGPREHNFTLSEFVIITDLAKIETVKKWDGTSFLPLAHNLGVNLFAKYCRTHKERAFIANVRTGSTDTPHVVLGSATQDSERLSSSDRPASSLGLDEPFFLPMPDLRPINGMESGFGIFLFSTEKGRLHVLTGANSFDFAIDEKYTGSAVVGDEAMINVGNDMALGLVGRIESLSGTLNFGDVEADDLSLQIAPLIERVTSWTVVYDRRLQKVLFFPNNQSAVFVLHKSLFNVTRQFGQPPLSPWSRWITAHEMDFNPSSVMQLVDPTTDQDVVYMGASGGRIFRIDGTGGTDGGTDNITVNRTSGLIRAPEGKVFNVKGRINYRKLFAATVTLSFQHEGRAVFDQDITITLPDAEEVATYGDSSYYNIISTASDAKHYGASFSSRLSRQDFQPAGQSSYFQVKVEIAGAADFQIDDIELNFEAA